MADNGNRGPNESFRRGGRRRREPPIIDAAATEIPAEPSLPEAGTTEAATPEPARAHDELSPTATEPVATSASPTAEPAGIAEPHDRSEPERDPVTRAGEPTVPEPPVPEEPVLFGSAMRDPLRGAEAFPAAAAPTEFEHAHDGVHRAESLDPAASEDRAGEPPSFSDPPPAAPAAAAPANANTLATALGVAAVLLLGVIGWLLYTGGQRGSDASAAVADLKARIAALEARPDPADLKTQLAALEKRVADGETDRAALGKQVAALAARPTAPAEPPAGQGSGALATVAAVAALAGRVDAIDGRLTALTADQASAAQAVAALPKPAAPDFGPVNARISALESALNAADAKMNGSDARFNAFDAKLNGFDTKVNDVDAKLNGFTTTTNGMTARSNGLEARIDDNASELAKLKSDLSNLPKVDLGPLRAAAAALDGRIVKIETQLAAPKDDARVTEARAVGSAADTRATPIAVVAEAVQRAIAAGTPYAPEIDALKSLGADPALLARLGPSAAGGVPSVDALTSQWNGVRGQVLATTKPIAPGGGATLNSFLASATSIVHVHEVGAVEGDDANAVVSRIDAALAQGDVATAVADWDKLPEAGKTASRSWVDAARGRLDAVAAAADLLQSAIVTLGRAPG